MKCCDILHKPNTSHNIYRLFLRKIIENVHVVTNPSSTIDTVEKNGNGNYQIRALPLRKAKEKLQGKNANTSNAF